MKEHPKGRIVLNIAVLGLLCFLLFYFAENSFLDIFQELRSTPLVILAAVTGLGLIYQLVEGQTIAVIAAPFIPTGQSFSFVDGFFTSGSAAFYRVVTLGAGTVVAEINYYKKKGLPLPQGIGTAALHMILYKLATIFYALLCLVLQFSWLRQRTPYLIPLILAASLAAALIACVLLILSSSLKLQIHLISISNRLFKSAKIRGWIDKGNLQIYALRETVQTFTKDPAALLKALAWNLLKLLFWYVLPFILLFQDHPELDLLQFFSLISFTIVLAGVLPAPAGVGSFEFVYLLLFKPLVGTVDAASSLLLYRFATYALPFLIGFCYVIVDKQRTIKKEIREVRQEKSSE